MRISLRMILVFLVASAISPSPAYAYIDPMSGSIILQALAAGFLAALFMLKRFWNQVAERFRRIWHRFSTR